MSNLSTMNGCFQKPSVFPRIMLKPRQVLFGIILFLGISFSPMVNNEVLEADLTVETTQFDENHDKLANAAENWHLASSKTIDGLTVKELSGNFNLAHGSFDPLLEFPPPIPDLFKNNNDFQDTGMKFIQLVDYDYQLLYELENNGEIKILEVLGDGNFIIRISSNSVGVLETLENSADIRWIENVHPGYRLHPDLLISSDFSTLAIVPTNDLGHGGYGELALDLVNYGANDAWCGYTMCQVEVVKYNQFILNAANDGRIIWVEPISQLTVHNSVARAISGVVSVENNA